ncbi:MAG: hypothetical protein AMXMBFR84_20140 [Candidatus Hydrogenedentota bacterium]
MGAIVRAWRNFVHARKFARVGNGCRFVGKNISVDGHVELGHYTRLRENILLSSYKGGKIVIGSRCLISNNVIIEAGQLVEIGDGAGIAENAVIRDGNHLIYGTDANWRYTPYIYKPVIIGPDAWIGSGAYVSLGVTIGQGAVLGANSVATKDIPAFEVWGGVPARFIRHRLKDLPPALEAEAKKLLEEQPIRTDRREWQ